MSKPLVAVLKVGTAFGLAGQPANTALESETENMSENERQERRPTKVSLH